MTTKTCKKCGWVCAIQDSNYFCPVCGTKFTTGICNICGRPVEYYGPDRRICKECYNKYTRKPDATQRLRQRRADMYQEWLEKIKKVPKSYPTLTENQWMNAIKHFNGCALCHDESIDARGYFVPFDKGGRYCDWNIVPLCEKCATKTKLNPNYFLSRPVGLTDIIDYLEVILNGAITESSK